jgi:alkylation response protein AidB-like acyl-CoA dehydrogenase
VIVPNFSHSEVIEAVFRRTRVPVGLMTAAKLLSSVEPIIRYQRQRFRGGASAAEGTPRFDLGLQMKEDVLHRLVDVWSTGEASASLGFAAVRMLDDFDSVEKAKEAKFEAEGIKGARAQLKTLRKVEKLALEYLELKRKDPTTRDQKRFEELEADELVQFVVLDSLSNVFCPACKLWCTGHGATTMREAVSLMGGYGITEDCNGFLGQKWMDAQLEATYEGPEAVQRRQLSMTMNNEVFLAQFKQWIRDMREVASVRPGTGACTLASAMDLWLLTIRHLQKAKDADGRALYQSSRQGVTFPLADALCWLVAAREFILDVLKIEADGPNSPTLAEGLDSIVQSYTDLSHVFTTRAAGESARVCAELVFGYNRHPSWDSENPSCYQGDEVDEMEGLIPGIGTQSRGRGEVIEDGAPLRRKAGPCVCITGMETFMRTRAKLDSCMTGSRLAKDRVASALTQVMIPETLDYPL